MGATTRCAWVLAVTLAASGNGAWAQGADAPTDAFERQQALLSGGREMDRLTLNLMMGAPNAEQAISAALAAGQLNPAEQQDGWEALCGHRFRTQRYADAAQACAAAEQLEPGSAAQAAAIAQIAADVPPMSWNAAGVRVPLRDGRIDVTANGFTTDAVLDTGAEIGVLMESVARAMGARGIGANASVGTTTEPVAGGLAIVDELQIGGATLRNFLAVVLPDAQLTIRNIRIPAIISLPALTAQGRAAFLEHGTVLALGDAAPDASGDGAPMYWDESGVGFAADFAGGRRGVHFDTGANQTYLLPAARGVLSAAEWATAQEVQMGLAGVGGERTEQGHRLSGVTLRIAEAAWRMESVDVAARDVNGEAARIGRDIFGRFEGVILDFDRMRIFVSE